MARFSLLDQQNDQSWTCPAQKQNVLSTKRSATKLMAINRPDKFDHLHHKCDKKTVNFTILSKRTWHMR